MSVRRAAGAGGWRAICPGSTDAARFIDWQEAPARNNLDSEHGKVSLADTNSGGCVFFAPLHDMVLDDEISALIIDSREQVRDEETWDAVTR